MHQLYTLGAEVEGEASGYVEELLVLDLTVYEVGNSC